MNAALKTRIANILTALVSVFAIVQTQLTSPPFTTETVLITGAVITYLTLAFTAWKQYLSAEVNSTGVKVTIWIAVAATVAGLVDLINIFHLSNETAQTVRWWITIIVAIINILSKQIFPSSFQKDKIQELKQQ